jgi:hypothetical protein
LLAAQTDQLLSQRLQRQLFAFSGALAGL